MVFQAAAGYDNFSDDALFPVIYSNQVLLQLQRKSVVEAITNTQYEGEIRSYGASVKIVKAPVVALQDYARGLKMNDQTIDTDSTELTIDQGKYFSFGIDVIEEQQSHIDLAGMTLDNASYQLRNAFDVDVLTYINAQAGINLGAITIGFGVGETTPLDLMGRFREELSNRDVMEEDTWVVISPKFLRFLQKEDSRYIAANEMGTSKSAVLDNNMVFTGTIHGFRVYMSNNLPANQILFGHKSAIATARTVSKSRVIENPDSFGKKYQGLLVWGRAALRPENVGKATLTYSE